MSSPGGSFDFDLVSIPTTECKGEDACLQEDRINEVLVTWDMLVANVHRMGGLFKHLQTMLGTARLE
jgi:hypothetical protein